MHEYKSVYKTFLEKPTGKTLLERHRCRWENIKTDLWEMDGRHKLDSSGTEQDLVLVSCERGDKPLGSTKARNFLTSWAYY
jgi:hypothetical protein